MGVFEHFPYTNFHDMNMDWIVEKIREVIEQVNSYEDRVEAVEQVAAELKEFVNNYFDNLDVQSEINRKIDRLVANGTMLQLVSDPAAEAASEYLAAHLTFPTTPPLDTSLTIANAAADSKAVGDALPYTRTVALTVDMLEQGALQNGTGVALSSGAARIRTVYIPVVSGTTITCTDLQFNIWEYNLENKSYIRDNGGWTRSWTVAQDCFVRIMWNNGSLLEYSALIAGTTFNRPVFKTGLLDVDQIQQAVASETSANVIVNGKDWEQGAYNAGGFAVTSNNRSAAIRPKSGIYAGRNVVVTWGDIPVMQTVGAGRLYISFLNSSGAQVGYVSADALDGIMWATAPANTTYIGIHTYSASSTDWHSCIPEFIQVEEGIIPSAHTERNVIPYDLIDKSSISRDVKKWFYSDVRPNEIIRSIGHRGNTTIAPECTVPAYVIAAEMGYRYVENDLTVTEDGALVMWHDVNLAKLGLMVDVNNYEIWYDSNYNFYYYDGTKVYTWNGSAYVESSTALSSLTRANGADFGVNSQFGVHGLTFAQLRRIDVGRWKNSRFAGTIVSTYWEFLAYCKYLGLHAYIDRKTAYTDEILQTIINTTRDMGMGSCVTFIGLHTVDQCNRVAEALPDAQFALLTAPTAALCNAYKQFGSKFSFDPDAADLTLAGVQLAHSYGLRCECYLLNVNNRQTYKDEISRLCSYGVDGITLDGIRVENAFSHMLMRYW